MIVIQSQKAAVRRGRPADIVDQNIQTAETFKDFSYNLFHAGGRADIGLDEQSWRLKVFGILSGRS